MLFSKAKREVQNELKKLGKELDIMVVEDNYSFRKRLLEDLITPIGFRSVTEADNGNQAFRLFQQKPRHLVFTDFDMKGCCGTELLRKCHKLNQTLGLSGPAAIIISQYDDASAIKELLDGIQVQLIGKSSFEALTSNTQKNSLLVQQREFDMFWAKLFHAVQFASQMKKVSCSKRTSPRKPVVH